VILVVNRSPLTGELHGVEMPITEEQCITWLSGKTAQIAFPNLPAPEREFIITGYTRADWKELFGAEDTTTRIVEEQRTIERQRTSEGMPPNPNGDPYGCGCDECMEFYRSLK
jgi:hypothetical protein